MDEKNDGLSPGRKKLAEVMAAPFKTMLKKGRFGACVRCGMDLRYVIVHEDDECAVYGVLKL